MQYLVLSGNETYAQLAEIYGNDVVDRILTANSIARVPNIGAEWKRICNDLMTHSSSISAARKQSLLSKLTDSVELFEKACLLDDEEWKVLSSSMSFPDALRIPDTVVLPNSETILGTAASGIQSTQTATFVQSNENSGFTSSASGSYQQSQRGEYAGGTSSSRTASRQSSRQSSRSFVSEADYNGMGAIYSPNPVPSEVYRNVIQSLETTGSIDSEVLNDGNISYAVLKSTPTPVSTSTNRFEQVAFPLPWGKIQMYSTVLKELINFPVYPEQIEKSRQASYSTMPDIIYQYEPWITYQSSGPRDQTLEFHMHRDMWTGNHVTDQHANQLIRFCEANTFADYNGSAVVTPLVRFYIDGSLFISGVIKNTNVTWTGPIGQDNWYLEFTLSLVIQEISESPLSASSYYGKKLKEG